MSDMTSDYAYQAQLDIPYEQAIDTVTAALKAEGFGVLTEIDVQATLKEKIDVDFRQYTILGACNPLLAHRALSAELGIGLMLPCNVIVYEDDNGGSVVALVDPISMLGVVDNPALKPVADEARERLKRVADSLNN